jgi:hypothetical protein
MLTESMMDYIHEHETNAVSVQVVPIRMASDDIVFKLSDRSALAVPRPLYAEYCRRIRPLKIYGSTEEK